MRRFTCLLALSAIALLFPTALAWALVPTQMNVQGRLSTAGGGAAPAGVKQFTFKVFDQEIGGVEIWPLGAGEMQTLSTDANGLWSAALGALIPLTEAVFDSPERWLQVTVNDGVNPPDVLPRVRLRTSPYSYHSATSRFADSLGSGAISGLSDLYVNVTGDVITGELASDLNVKDSGASVDADNLNDGWPGKWADTVGTWGITADVSGNASSFNVGVAGSAQGNNNGVDANYGLLGYANGTGSINVGLQASTGEQGTANYSGYFYNGDFLVDAPSTPGTGGVLLPPDAISAAEVFDEPGLASNTHPAEVILNSTAMSDIVTVTLTIPAAGYIKLDATGNMLNSGTTGTCYAWYQIDEAAGGSFANGYYSGGGEAGYVSMSGSQHSLYLQRVYFKAAGTYSFRMEGQSYQFNAGGAVASCRNAILTATYYPSSYGQVTTLTSAKEAGGMESAKLVQPTRNSPAPGENSDAQFLVDLRELELRAARAEAEAERARREYLEAHLRAVHTPGSLSGNAKSEGDQ